MDNIREVLEQQMEETRNGLVECVISDALDHEGSELTYLKDVLEHGCISGMVSGLIYTVDTHIFFDKYYEEIEDLRIELLEQGIDVLSYIGDNDLKNHMAWIAYEETARLVLDEL